ncbi:spore germination protein KB [Ruminiclostridium sufflavum DSM 19573]|uniref:Spore germination protein KB n=1 Tax=Ruminiclostridium sufflavum DSM 19573 TaxID=1121337 RepID=A0A318XI49_9FIRM|nr:endospore germination permease [Ruminiclostridium sufflavum]PYG86900.1 spore germination protein KB [Ruminiclostridium sufflavum DSM 19573]
MKLEQGSISTKDLMIGIICFIQATVLRSGYIVGITRQDSWAMAVTGFLFSLPLVFIYAALLKKHPGKNLIEIDDIIFGPVLGKIISVLYLFFFASLAALNARDLGNFVADYMMPETPITVIILIFMIGCVYTLCKGIENLMHLSAILAILSIGAIVINFILVLRDIQPWFLKPLFQLEPMRYVQGTVSVVTVPMGEILAFTMLMPLLEKDTKIVKPMVLGLLFSAVTIGIVILRDIVTLGPLAEIVSLPSFESVRYVSISGILTRMESVYAVVLVILFLFKVSILLYAFALGLTEILSRNPRHSADSEGQSCKAGYFKSQKSHPPLLFICAALIYFYSLFVFESVMENVNWGATTAPFFALTFEFLLPVVSLLVAFLRGNGRAKEVQS